MMPNNTGCTLSIVIVNWNAKRYLLDCLASIARTSNALAPEIIVVDNASHDGSVAAVRQAFPSVTLIENRTNTGFARANNRGIQNCRGRYIALVNSDVIVRDNCLQQLVACLDQHPEIGLAGPCIRNADDTIQPSIRAFPSVRNSLCETFALQAGARVLPFLRGQFLPAAAHGSDHAVDVLSGCFWMVRREMFDTVGLLDEGFFIYGEDVDWCRRLRQAGGKAAFVPAAEAIHFGGASSANAPVRFYLAMQAARLRYWRKHHGRAGAAFFQVNLFLYQFLRLIPRTIAGWIRRGRRGGHDTAKRDRAAACLRWLFSNRKDTP